VRNHDDGEDNAGNDVTDNDLDERNISAISRRGNTDDGERAGFGGDDGKANAPPWSIFAAKEVVACVLLVFAEPNAKANHSGKVKNDDEPICCVEELHLDNYALE
jgi:hypothetical protein